MFSLFNNNKTKACEYCGEESDNFIYRFIAEVEYLIFLKNSGISYHHQTERYVIINEKRFDYSALTDPDHAVNFKKLIPHIFCSELCEDRFLKKYSQYFRLDIHEDNSMINYNTEQIFAPVSFPVEAFEHRQDTCKHCNSHFPNYNKTSYILNIIEMNKLDGKLIYDELDIEKQPQLKQHELIISNINKENVEGHYYIYKTGMDKEFFNFCSNDCVFNYCNDTNSLCISISNIEKGNKCVITPDIVDINKALSNIYKYRPIKFDYYDNLPLEFD